MRAHAVAVCTIVACAAGATRAGAQTWIGQAPWCIQPPVGGGVWHCVYDSYLQCEASRRGAQAGNCVRSPALDKSMKVKSSLPPPPPR